MIAVFGTNIFIDTLNGSSEADVLKRIPPVRATG